jgi:hypothetical protein
LRLRAGGDYNRAMSRIEADRIVGAETERALRDGDVGERLSQLVNGVADRATIAAFLDGLASGQRVAAIRALSGARVQARLWAAVADAPRVTLADLVPTDASPLAEVIYEGKNSLLAFTTFQKRFCRPPAGGDQLWGYNHQTLAWLTGPGYFVVHDDPRGAGLDYRAVPPTKPPAWPAIRTNDQGVARLVYGNMVDYMRRVSRDVFIGRAVRGGKETSNYFILCRV